MKLFRNLKVKRFTNSTMLSTAMLFAIGATAVASNADAGKVNFVSPKDGDTVPQKFLVKFGVSDMKVEKAGIMKPGTGHHHLIVDGGEVAKGMVIPKDATHMHFGDGKTETELSLPPGKHTLTLQFADGAHASLGSEYAKTITVNVK